MGAHTHSHSHAHAHPGDAADAGRARERALRFAIALTFAFAAVEAVGGWWAGSLALLADAGHMLSDSAALFLAWIAARLSQRPPSARLSYGWRRAEVLSALVNTVLMFVLVLLLVPAAIDRLQSPHPVQGGSVLLIAGIGLLVNLAVFRVLHAADRGALNTRGALLHVLGDLLGSVAALVAGAMIWTTGWTPIDPLLSLFIAVLILVSALRLLRDVLHVLMEAVPAGLDLDAVRARLLATSGVTGVHDLHVWTLAGDRLLLSAHIGIADSGRWWNLLAELQRMLRDEFGIGHATLQAEPPEYAALSCEDCEGATLDDHEH
ncbi:MAG TPA: cation diffusion facilitator family transporter [Arenimonas sp.]|nr:cation diffusion facilitator family transporter [Arenimonas sp.]